MHLPYLYTETAFNHQGDFDYLKKCIEATAEAGFNGIKFQIVLDLNELMSAKHKSYKLISGFVFTKEEWVRIIDYAFELDLDIIVMPLDKASANLIAEIQDRIKFIDIHSVSFYDKHLLHEISKINKPIILGVGGRTISEIDEKLNYFQNVSILMVGFQSFPSHVKDVRLGKISFLQRKYPDLLIGYADHSSNLSDDTISTNEWAYLLGASIFEKHITLEEESDRVDNTSSIGKEKLAEVKIRIDRLSNEVLLSEKDSYYSGFSDKELDYRNRQKVFVASRDLNEDHLLTEQDLILKMSDSEDGITDIKDIIGRKIQSTIEKDQAITSEILH